MVGRSNTFGSGLKNNKRILRNPEVHAIISDNHGIPYIAIIFPPSILFFYGI